MKKPSLDADLLSTFLSVLDHGRISAAASAVHLSQPAVTGRIRRLEEDLGVSLLVRSVQGVSPTPAGERLAVYARQVHSLLDQAMGELSEKPAKIGALEIGVSTTIASCVIPKVLANFRAHYPQVQIKLEIGNTQKVVEQVRERGLLALVEGHRRAAGVRQEAWIDDELIPVVGRESNFRPRNLLGLESVPLLWREPGSGTRAVLARAFREAAIRTKPKPGDLVLSTTESIKGAAIAGLGLAFLSRWSIAHDLNEGRLRRIPALDLKVRRTFHWALPSGGLSGTSLLFYNFARRQPPLSP